MAPLQLYFNDTDAYIPPVFERTHFITNMHETPRFGLSNDIMLLNGSLWDIQEYLNGVFAIPFIILSIFFVWATILTILKCLGERAGCASGAPYIPPNIITKHDYKKMKPENGSVFDGDDIYNTPEWQHHSKHTMKKELSHDIEAERYNNEMRRVERRLRAIRICFLVSGLFAIVSSISFLFAGVNALQTTAEKAHLGINDVQEIIKEGANITSAFLRQYNNVIVADSYYADESLWCPKSGDREGHPYLGTIRKNVNNVRESIKSLDSGFTTEMNELYDDLITTENGVHLVNYRVNEAIDNYLVIAMGVAIFQIGIVVVLMSGVVWTCAARLPTFLRCTQSYFFLPILIISNLVSIVLSTVFLAGSIAGSDFCYPSPDLKIAKILQANKEFFGPFVIRVLTHYIMGCKDKEVLDVRQYITMFEDAHNKVNDFLTLSQKNSQLLDLFCGGGENSLFGITSLLDDALHNLAQSIDDTIALTSCSNINSVYARITYDVACHDAINMLYGICFSQLGIAFFSMIMITLRVSWQHVESRKLNVILTSA